jgi:hypothetical protein
MTPGIRAKLVDAFRTDLLHCAAEFGGPASLWPARYGL